MSKHHYTITHSTHQVKVADRHKSCPWDYQDQGLYKLRISKDLSCTFQTKIIRSNNYKPTRIWFAKLIVRSKAIGT